MGIKVNSVVTFSLPKYEKELGADAVKRIIGSCVIEALSKARIFFSENGDLAIDEFIESELELCAWNKREGEGRNDYR